MRKNIGYLKNSVLLDQNKLNFINGFTGNAANHSQIPYPAGHAGGEK